MGTPTRFPDGVTNRGPIHPMGNLPMPDPTKCFQFYEDFYSFTYAAADITGWVDTAASAATAAAVVSGAGGVVLFAPQAANAAFGVYQWGTNTTVHPMFLPVAGKKFWLRARFKTEDADQNNLYVGGAVASVDPFGTEPADQFVFRSLNAAPDALQFAAGKTNSTEVTISLGTTADNTWTTCSAYYDGRDTVSAWREDDNGLILARGSVSVTNGTLLPDALLVPTFGMQGKDNGGDDFSIDFLHLAIER